MDLWVRNNLRDLKIVEISSLDLLQKKMNTMDVLLLIGILNILKSI